MTKRCRRAWEAEAARDGRLTGAAREDIAAHQRSCASCARAGAALETLAEKLRALAPHDAEVDEIALRRLRSDILEAVDSEHTGRRLLPLQQKLVRALVVAAALGLFVVGLAAWRAHHGRSIATTATVQAAKERAPKVVPPETRVDVTASAGARYTRSLAGDVEVLTLEEGTLRLRVTRAEGGRRVLVKVPDGEIEDVGTVFDVLVAGGRTESVGVDEGRVVVRVGAEPPSIVEAGGAWRRARLAPVPVPVPATTAATTRAAATAATAARPNARVTPNDSAEDVAYLDVLRLVREGREADARAAAGAYLRAFPDGFRRKEMERLLAAAR